MFSVNNSAKKGFMSKVAPIEYLPLINEDPSQYYLVS